MDHMPKYSRAVLAGFLFLVQSTPALGESFHWVDLDGFHFKTRIDKVPLEQRRALPMAKNRTALPFTADEDRDGAMYVWFVLGQAGVLYPYTRAADFAASPLFIRVETPQNADIAWWQGFVALYRGSEKRLLSSNGESPLAELERVRGKATWYRYNGPPPANKPVVDKLTPKKALKDADKLLARLDAASTSPPRLKDQADCDRLRKVWQQAVDFMKGLRRKYPDDPKLLRRLGECYRIGHNLDMPGTWDRAEAYLLRAEVLAPDAPEAYIALGAHYADTDFGYGEQAEAQFRQALRFARKEQLPQVWWGLAISLYYQGKTTEAVAAIDRLIAIIPGDLNARKLRETFVEAGRKK